MQRISRSTPDTVHASTAPRPRLAVVQGMPARPVAQLRFALPRATPVAAYVLNSAGQIIHTLCQEHLEPGEHLCAWDGLDSNGARPAPGIYTLRLEAGARVLCVRVVSLT